MHTQAESDRRERCQPVAALSAATGLLLYGLTFLGEGMLGAGPRWLLAWLGAATVGAIVPLGLSAEQLALISAFAPLAWSLLALVVPGRGRLWARRLGARRASADEALAIEDARALLRSVDPELPEPRAYVLDDPLPAAASSGGAVLLSRGLLESDSVPAVYAHELGHVNGLDARLTEALDRLELWGDPLGPVEPRRGVEAPAADDDRPRGLLLGIARWALRLAGGGCAERLMQSSDNGSGLRFERLRVDGAERYVLDYQAIGSCDTSYTSTNGEFARKFQPCPTGGPYGRSYSLNTAGLGDGAHSVSACTQDFGQYQGLNGTGSESCTQRTIRTDNHAPGAPSGLRILTSNPNRYQRQFGAKFALPPDPGSPITKLHYYLADTSGNPVMPAQVLSTTNPTEIPAISGPKSPGAYRLRVWLEDGVGFTGQIAEVDVLHDTKPPAAPQDLRVLGTTAHRVPRFDLRWRNIVDSGSPIAAAHYQVLDASGKVVVPTTTVRGEGIESIAHLDAPTQAGPYTLRLWLSDAEDNAGAPVTAPLAYRCVRSAVPGGAQLTASLAGRPSQAVRQGRGATLAGSLRNSSGAPLTGAPLCVFSRVVTDPGREFLGIALTNAAGSYRFAIGAGPSRQLSVLYRPGQRRLRAAATLQTIVHPTLRARRTVVPNKRWAHLEGEIPGPPARRWPICSPPRRDPAEALAAASYTHRIVRFFAWECRTRIVARERAFARPCTPRRDPRDLMMSSPATARRPRPTGIQRRRRLPCCACSPSRSRSRSTS